MTNEPINILIASDINYAPYYGVMLTSLFINNNDSAFDIYLITDETWPDSETKKFEKLCAKYHSTFHVYAIDATKMDDFPKTGHINKATYYNLNAANILPAEVHRVIYMDGDMIVDGDISPLWELDLKGNACAMALSCAYYEPTQYERLGYDSKWGYYNNGVTVYDMDYLRKMNFAEKALQLITTYPERMTWMDQDVQNVLLHDKMYRLPFRYNMQALALTKERWQHQTEEFKRQILDAANQPIVVHYNGHKKPWDFNYYGFPYDELWNKYCGISLWKGFLNHAPSWKYIKHLSKRVFKKSSFKEYYRRNFISFNFQCN